ncbi:hypothetical protein DPMN_189619 [Dreissena polymorpha]|uniref:Uncharacterized protein n=1 Tax=Dreissena polymorpha TaxID=45954 RepID=A0A9D4DVU8_DREPO|nr:hypothetical protein DPMN_189619 [Dreissena polymorpha]
MKPFSPTEGLSDCLAGHYNAIGTNFPGYMYVVPEPTMNNRAILEGATSLTPPSIAFSSIKFSTGKTNVPVLFFNKHIIRTNLLTKKNAPPHVGHIFQKLKPVLNSAELSLEALVKFHKDLTINVTSREVAIKNALN